MTTIDTRLGTIGYERSGSSGIPLLFLHGVGSNRHAWDGQVERFGAERLTLAMDLPGYGDSALLPGATRDDFAAAALAFLDALSIERAHVCGLSLGGVLAIAMHAQAPERIASLILADTFACHPEGEAILARSLAGMEALGMRGLAESRADALLAQPAAAAVKTAVIETMAAIDPAAYVLAAKAVWLADQRREARAIECPTLILCGSEDRITPPSLSDELKDLIAHATLVEITGAGHLPNLEQPAIFDRIVAAFLSGVDEKA
ncbi:alpha/beta hydrolase [Sphingomonas swuensis]|uniref:Alpha/beta hydrolase n=1 Tax=Sphingomonas swuensis TaxID=977800 RepID=A0ABP7TBQ6_9SPHN